MSVLVLFLYLLGLVVALVAFWDKGESSLTLDDHLWRVVSFAAIFGSIGGLAYDIGTPLRPSPTWNPETFENKTMVPRFGRDNTELEWGFIGPMLVGVVAALVAVFLLVVEHPEPPADLITGIEQRLEDRGVSLSDINALELAEPLPPSVDPSELLWVSLIAGFAGAVLLRTIGSRLVETAKAMPLLAKSVSTQVVKETSDEAGKQVDKVITKNKKTAKTKVRQGLNALDLSSDKEELRQQVTSVVAQALAEASAESAKDATTAKDQISKRAKEASSKAVTELMEGSSGNPPSV